MLKIIIAYFLGIIWGIYNNIFPVFLFLLIIFLIYLIDSIYICIEKYIIKTRSTNKEEKETKEEIKKESYKYLKILINIFKEKNYISKTKLLVILLVVIIGYINVKIIQNRYNKILYNDYIKQEYKEREVNYSFIKKNKEEKVNSKKDSTSINSTNNNTNTNTTNNSKENKFDYTKYYDIKQNEKTGSSNYIITPIEEVRYEYKSEYICKIQYTNKQDKIKVEEENEISKILIKVEFKNTKLELFKKYSIKGRLEEFSISRNYKGFNSRLYNLSKGVYFKIESHNEKVELLENENMVNDWFLINIYRIKEYLKNEIRELNKKYNFKNIGLIESIIYGSTSNIESDVIDKFKETNTYHMVAVSSINFMIVIYAFEKILRVLSSGKILNSILLIILIFGYIILSGVNSSIMRLGLIKIIQILFILFNKKVSFIYLLKLSFLSILLLNPYKVYDNGMYFTYFGVITVILVNNLLNKYFSLKDKLKKNKRESKFQIILEKILKYSIFCITIQIVLIPLQMYILNQINFNILGNIILVPIFNLVVVIVMMLFILLIFKYFIFSYFKMIISYMYINEIINIYSQYVDYILNIFGYILDFINSFNFKILYVKQISIYTVILIYLVLYLIYLFLSRYLNILNNLYDNKIKKNKSKSESESQNKKKYDYNIGMDIRIRNVFKNINTLVVNIFTKKIIILLLIVFIFSINILEFENIYNVRFTNLVSFIDVGQGDSSLIKTQDGLNILIDTGTGKNMSNSGEKIIMPYLLKRRVNKLDYLIISHFDSDHSGGAKFLIENLKVKNLIISKQEVSSKEYIEIINLCKKKRINIIYMQKGNVLNISKKLKLSILAPDNTKMIKENPKNNNSLVCLFEFKSENKNRSDNKSNNKKILYTGDIENIAEKQIVDNNFNIKVDILKVAHHGSNTSSSSIFLNAYKSTDYIISCGIRNRYNHPSNNVLDRIKEIGGNILRTDKIGEIVYVFK